MNSSHIYRHQFVDIFVYSHFRWAALKQFHFFFFQGPFYWPDFCMVQTDKLIKQVNTWPPLYRTPSQIWPPFCPIAAKRSWCWQNGWAAPPYHHDLQLHHSFLVALWPYLCQTVEEAWQSKRPLLSQQHEFSSQPAVPEDRTLWNNCQNTTCDWPLWFTG